MNTTRTRLTVCRVLCIISLVLLFSGDALAKKEPLGKTVVYLRDGNIVSTGDMAAGLDDGGNRLPERDKFTTLTGLNISGMVFSEKERLYKMDIGEMRRLFSSIELLSPDLEEYRDGKLKITRRDGRKIDADGSLLKFMGYPDGTRFVDVLVWDGLNQDWKEGEIPVSTVRKIEFAESVEIKTGEKPGFASTESGILKMLNGGAAKSVNLKIEFDVNSHLIRLQSISLLDDLGRALTSKELAGKKVVIKGHTDSDGSASYNLKLSRKRARSVKDYLVTHFSIPSSRIETKGYGEKYPIAPNNSRLNKEMNRRVEISVRN